MTCTCTQFIFTCIAPAQATKVKPPESKKTAHSFHRVMDANCLICLQPMDHSATGDDAVFSLPCCHTFHKECLNRNCEVHHTQLEHLRCPQCRLTPHEIGQRAIQLENNIVVEDSPNDVEPNGVEFDEVVEFMDIEPPAAETAAAADPEAPAAEPAAAAEPEPAAAEPAADAEPETPIAEPETSAAAEPETPAAAPETPAPKAAAKPRAKRKAKAKAKVLSAAAAESAPPSIDPAESDDEPLIALAKAKPKAKPQAKPKPQGRARNLRDMFRMSPARGSHADVNPDAHMDAAEEPTMASETAEPTVDSEPEATDAAVAGGADQDEQPEMHPIAGCHIAPPLPKEVVFCMLCSSECEAKKGRYVGKQEKKFKCNKCLSTVTKLYKEGRFSAADFESLSEEERKNFFQKAGGLSAKETAKLADESLQKFKKQTVSWAFGGDYLPLSVWAARGFDTERIKENTDPEDVSFSPQLGTTYRVRVMNKSEQGEEGTYRASEISTGSNGPKRARIDVEQATEETRAEFEARLQKARDARKVIDKEQAAVKSAAVQGKKRLSSAIESLKKVSEEPGYQHVAPVIKNACANVLLRAEQLITEMDKCIAGEKHSFSGNKQVIFSGATLDIKTTIPSSQHASVSANLSPVESPSRFQLLFSMLKFMIPR